MNKNSSVTVQDVAARINGKVRGDSSTQLSGVKPLDLAGPQDLTFFSPTSKRNLTALFEAADQSKAGAIFVSEFRDEISATQIKTPNPLGSLVSVVSLFYQAPKPQPGVHPSAVVAPSATLGRNVAIDALAVIGENVHIGDNTVVFPHVVVYPEARIGSNCILHAHAIIREYVQLHENCIIQNGAVIGGDGFGYIQDNQAKHQRIPHVGTVVLQEGVDIGANTTIDRATLGQTSVGTNTKVDNLVMIGHNCQIGSSSLLCGHVGISGSCKIGNNVILSGKVGVADHTEIGNDVRSVALAGLHGVIPGGQDIGGYPWMRADRWRRISLAIKKLPELIKRVRCLEKKLEEQ